MLNCKSENVFATDNCDSKREFGWKHKIHKRFLTESTGSTQFAKEESDNVYGPRPSVLMDINSLEIRSLFTKLSLGITLVV